MQDIELYQQLLGLSAPWKVGRVTFQREAQEIEVEAARMGLWEPFFNSTLAHMPGAAGQIVHDPFHLVSYMNAALNEVRKAEHRVLLEAGQTTLSGSKQLWL